jgi:hypothetical protein
MLDILLDGLKDTRPTWIPSQQTSGVNGAHPAIRPQSETRPIAILRDRFIGWPRCCLTSEAKLSANRFRNAFVTFFAVLREEE